MSKSNPSSVTAEEAVARMVNMDYIPEGLTLEDMLAAFQEEAEVNYENAKTDRLNEEAVESMELRATACNARVSLAYLLLKDLAEQAVRGQGTTIVVSKDRSSKTRYTLESVSDWASDRYGISIPEWSLRPAESSSDAAWEDIEIRIRANNRIAYSCEKGKWTEKTFDKIGLLDRKTQGPNHHAGILIGLSQGQKFPDSKALDPKHKTAVTKLRRSLKNLTGIDRDPFTTFNETDGWKPRFQLSDDRRNADNRAKESALHKQYDDKINYDAEDDDTNQWIKDNQ